MNYTHASMTRAIADVAEGHVPVASWASGEGWSATAEKGRKPGTVVTRAINPEGSVVEAFTLSAKDVRGYIDRAR